jgi:hypothetical protein
MVAGRSLPAAANGATVAGSLGCERERESRIGKERSEEEERAAWQFKYLSRTNHIDATKSRHLLWHNWHPRITRHMACLRATTVGATQANVAPHWHQSTSLHHESCHVHWHDSMCRINLTGVIQRG